MWTNSFLSIHTVKCNICSLVFSLKINSNFVFRCFVFSVSSTVSMIYTQFPWSNLSQNIPIPIWMAMHSDEWDVWVFVPHHTQQLLSTVGRTKCRSTLNENSAETIPIRPFVTMRRMRAEWVKITDSTLPLSGIYAALAHQSIVETADTLNSSRAFNSKHIVVQTEWVDSHFRLVSLLRFQCVTVACCEEIFTHVIAVQTKSKEAQYE